MNNFMQKLGKSLMLPIAVLPICGILMGIGYMIYPEVMQNGEVIGFWQYFSFLLVKAGSAVIYNIPWLFVIGVSLGMSDDNHGAACLSGLVSWLVFITLLSTDVTSVLFKKMTTDSIQYLAFSKIQNPFIGIVAGLIGATSYNKFKDVKLPEVLAFFSGRRFVAIATVFFSMILSAILLFVWPLLFRGLALLGNLAVGMGGFGACVYAFFNRLLIPSGLHHVLNNIFWFDTIGIGDLTNYWAGKTSADVTWSLGMYMSGLFPCMMFGIPGAALAMYKSASCKNKKMAFGILLSASLCSIICGLTEPFEFIFLFTAFPLYVVYSLLYGLFYIITYYTGFRAGLSFSGGLVDFLCSSTLPAAANSWQILPLGIAAFVIFYAVFRFSIVKFKLPIFDDSQNVIQVPINVTTGKKIGDKFEIMAHSICEALGGKANIVSVDCCATRLRLELNDASVIDETAVKNAGALGVRKTSPKNAQVIIGMTVQQVCEALKNLLNGDETDSVNAITVQHGQILDNPWNEKKFVYVIKDKVGIHARPAGKLAKLVSSFDVKVVLSANAKTADAMNITDVMYLGASTGTEVTVEFEGVDADKAFSEVKVFFEKNL